MVWTRVTRPGLLQLILGLLALSVAIGGYLATRAQSTSRQIDKSKLVTLKHQIDALPDRLQITTNTGQDLAEYDAHLTSMLDTCQSLRDDYQATSNHNTIAQDVDQLCSDLIPVIIYSRALYQSTRDYLTIDDSWWSSSDGLGQIIQLITSTQAALVQLGQGQFDDPAHPEFITQLKTAQDLASRAQSSASQSELAQLKQTITQDRRDFLSARVYFWYNTIQLKALQKSINKLLEQVDS